MSSQLVPRSVGPSQQLGRMPLLEHLEELRKRLFRALIAVGLAFLVCWRYIEPICNFLAQPIYRYLPKGSKLTFLGVTDPFILYFKVAALVALFVASPVVLYQLWRFVSPGLYKRERYWALPFVFFGTFFFISGGVFAYYVAFPYAVQFLLGIGSTFQPMITIERYFRFLITVILGLGLMFELPILIFLLAQIGIVTPRGLMRQFRWAVLLIFIAAAIITPTPDIVNMCIFAIPTIGLYLLGVGAAALVPRLTRRREESGEDDAGGEDPGETAGTDD